MNADPKRSPRKREPRMKGATKHSLTAAVLADGAEEASFRLERGRDAEKGPQWAKSGGERE